ncbi:sulfotransferase [Janibacter sp. DB-40]|uniref:sulfotransferase family protein n=1 Tax=Janibacter sp. DB-40 TaxID=3028808 RepID=UPI0024060230|nr:sulfotransferase [Janibacter sp. DB-40]
MPLPNFLIVGSQKSGTSWLHRSLGRSKHIFASQVKELNFFNQADFDAPEKLAAFREHFPQRELPGVQYYLESTPHYFRARPTTARNIRSLLGSPEMVAVFRDPVDRYESAYIHHMMRGRFPYTPVIDELTDEYSVLSLGRYAEALESWWGIHPQLKPMLYDDLVGDPLGFVTEVMDHLGLTCDITMDELTFRANDKTRKKSQLGPEWEEMPTLDPGLRRRLHEEYAEDTRRLEEVLGRDLSAWRAVVASG